MNSQEYSVQATAAADMAPPSLSTAIAPAPQAWLAHQRVKIWIACTLWPVAIFLEPGLWSISPFLGFAFILFPSIWLYCWLGVLMHEAAHNYFPGTNNRIAYNVLSLMLFMDPQIFLLTHATHHIHVNTWQDRQFHPLGRIESRTWRRVVNVLEIVLGDVFFIVAGTVGVIRDARLRKHYRPLMGVVWNLCWMVSLAAILTLSAFVFHLTFWQTILPAALGGWLCALVLRHNELVQHGGLFVEGSLAKRNMATRNLAANSLAARIFLFLTHDDAAKHVLHHTQGQVYSRPFGNHFAAPEGAVFISLRQYGRILADMVRCD